MPLAPQNRIDLKCFHFPLTSSSSQNTLLAALWSTKQSTCVRLWPKNKTGIRKSLAPPQAQEGRAGEAHVSPAREQTGADGAAGGSHEAAEGKTLTCFVWGSIITQHGA